VGVEVVGQNGIHAPEMAPVLRQARRGRVLSDAIGADPGALIPFDTQRQTAP
jgi:hypothetical protein